MSELGAKDIRPAGHSDQYKQLLSSLLQGDVVCRWSQPVLSRQLERPDIRTRIDQWVSEIDMELASTANETGYYLAYRGFDQAAKNAARETLTGIMRDLRFNVRMLELLMNIMHADSSLVPGEQLRYSDALRAINESPNLRTQLAELPCSRKHSVVKDQLDALITRLKRDGVIVESNAKHSIYQLTAKLDLIQEIIIFIQESENIPILDQDGAKQGNLV